MFSVQASLKLLCLSFLSSGDHKHAPRHWVVFLTKEAFYQLVEAGPLNSPAQESKGAPVCLSSGFWSTAVPQKLPHSSVLFLPGKARRRSFSLQPRSRRWWKRRQKQRGRRPSLVCTWFSNPLGKKGWGWQMMEGRRSRAWLNPPKCVRCAGVAFLSPGAKWELSDCGHR